VWGAAWSARSEWLIFLKNLMKVFIERDQHHAGGADESNKEKRLQQMDAEACEQVHAQILPHLPISHANQFDSAVVP
jgi:16S rRNA U1498 N3-methylase RsmE